MGIRDRIKGVLANALNTFLENLSESTGETGKPSVTTVDETGRPSKIRFDEAQRLPRPPVSVPKSNYFREVEPFTAKTYYDPRLRNYVDPKTRQIISRDDMERRLADHRQQVLANTIARRRRNLDDNEIMELVNRIEEARSKLNEHIETDGGDFTERQLRSELRDIIFNAVGS